MDAENIINIAQDSVMVLLKLSLPLLLVALFVGVLISLIQALTQIQEPTISFVPKIIAVFFSIFLSLNYMGSILSSYMENIVSHIINVQ